MYFQNPPTNFIDKFVLIINPLQMNVNFFLGHQCKILRLTRGKQRWVDGNFVCVQGCGEDGRRKILRLYKADAVGMEGWDMGDDK